MRNKSRSTIGRRSRQKGAEFEREVASVARELGYSGARREAPMQSEHPSLFRDVAAVGILAIEAKRYRRTPVNRVAREWLTRGEVPGWVPALVYRDDGQPEPYAVVTLRDLLKLERRAFGRDLSVEAGQAALVRELSEET
jgi:hypothetical protein